MSSLFRLGFRLALVATFFTAFQTSVLAVDSLKDGKWADTLSWVGEKTPAEDAQINLYHNVYITGEVKVASIVVRPGAQLYFSSEGGIPRLVCGKLIVMEGARVYVPSTVDGCYLTCGDIEIHKEGGVFGKFESFCSGLNMTCGAVRNEGMIDWKTGNYITINGDITNNGLFQYSGNGLLCNGDTLRQDNPDALMDVAGFYHQLNWSNPDNGFASFNPKPLIIRGKVQFRNTRMYDHGGPFTAADTTSGIWMNGGYFSGVVAKNLTIAGKGHFSIGSSVLENCVLEDTIHSSNFTLVGKTIINGHIRPQEWGTPYGGSNSITSYGELLLNGCLEDSTDNILSVNYEGVLINNGFVQLNAGSIMGYSLASLVNNSLMKSSVSLKRDSIPSPEGFIYQRIRIPYVVNNSTLDGNFGVDTVYTITSKSTGSWAGNFNGISSWTEGASKLIGTHHFVDGNVEDLVLTKDTYITGSRVLFNRIDGNGAAIMVKSGCSFTETKNCNVQATKSVVFEGKNSGTLLAMDTLLCRNFNYTGDLITQGVTTGTNQYTYEVNGSWQNYGTLVNNDVSTFLMNGNFLNAGKTINTNITVKGMNSLLLQTGEKLGDVSLSMKDKSRTVVWFTNPANSFSYLRFRPDFSNMYQTIYSKNAQAGQYYFLMNPGLADTATYVLAEKSPGTSRAAVKVVVNNPYNFLNPLPSTRFLSGEVQMLWPAIPFASGYKVRFTKLNGLLEESYLLDSTTTDTVYSLQNLEGLKIKAYLSARIADRWSPETEGLLMDFSRISALDKTSVGSLRAYSENQQLHLGVESLSACNAPVVLYDTMGKCVYSAKLSLKGGLNELVLPVRVSKGLYILEITLPENKTRVRLMI